MLADAERRRSGRRRCLGGWRQWWPVERALGALCRRSRTWGSEEEKAPFQGGKGWRGLRSLWVGESRSAACRGQHRSARVGTGSGGGQLQMREPTRSPSSPGRAFSVISRTHLLPPSWRRPTGEGLRTSSLQCPDLSLGSGHRGALITPQWVHVAHLPCALGTGVSCGCGSRSHIGAHMRIHKQGPTSAQGCTGWRGGEHWGRLAGPRSL